MKLKKESLIIIIIAVIVIATVAWLIFGKGKNPDNQNNQQISNMTSQDQQELFNNIKEVGETSENFDSTLVIQCYEIGKNLFPDESISIVYTADETGRVDIEGKKCYKVSIVKENLEGATDADILGYIALSLDTQEIYFQEVNGEFKKIEFVKSEEEHVHEEVIEEESVQEESVEGEAQEEQPVEQEEVQDEQPDEQE